MKFLRPYVSFCFLIIALHVSSCQDAGQALPAAVLQLSVVRVGTVALDLADFTKNKSAPNNKPIVATFSSPLDLATVPPNVKLQSKTSGLLVDVVISFLDNDKSVSIVPSQSLKSLEEYQLVIGDQLKGAGKELFPGFTVSFTTIPGSISISSLKINSEDVLALTRITDIPVTDTQIELIFTSPLSASTITTDNIRIFDGNKSISTTLSLADDNTKVTVRIDEKLKSILKYQLQVTADVKGVENESLSYFSKFFYSTVNTDPVFPIISDDALLTLTEQQTFAYFWDFAQSNSGMARERNTSGDLVTTGGSGFGLMTIIVGIERGFITRAQGIERFNKILNYLETADRFHGAWPHWINGNTGKVIPFSANDNGGDLVETSFLVQGLITVRQYLSTSVPQEVSMIDRINVLWKAVEWDWYTRSQNVLYWHWSPDRAWIMNLPIGGYNEALITYVLAASSPTHTISKEVYDTGWAKNGGIKNGKTFYGITLPVGYDYGGPMFFAHYSFLGLDPRDLNDAYANYWTQNVNHTGINQAHCIANPKNYIGYSASNWGLTASDNQSGYSAHSPTNDKGVISPTAALSSFPYKPEASMAALKFFYYTMGDRLWGTYGFYDAYNLTEGWTATSTLAIDQGPIIIMIENHRTGLLWDLFMSAPEVQSGLTKLGFTY